jgi:hypothetical protein
MSYAAFLGGEAIRGGALGVCYAAAFAATTLLIDPVQQMAVGSLPAAVSLCFLPHGVRVIAAWLFGWRAALYLVLPALLMQPFVYGEAAYTAGPILVAAAGVLCAPLAFSLMRWVNLDAREFSVDRPQWRSLMLAGTIASIINGAAAVGFLGSDAKLLAAYWIGDVGGLFAALIVLILLARMLRRKRV